MDLLRTLTSALGHYDPDAADNSPPGQLPQGRPADGADRLAGGDDGTGQCAAAAPIPPDPVLGHAANFLYMLTGERPSALATRAFDVALILHADHELNASTFAARVAAATLTDIHSAIVGGDRRAQGAAARRRQRRRDAAAARDRRRRAARRRPKRSCAPSWRARKRFPASAIASITPRIRARRICGRCRAIWGSAPASRPGSRCRSGSRRWSRRRRSSTRTSTSTRRRPTTRSAFRSICSRRFSPSAASRAGRRTCSSSTPTTG